MFQWLTTAELCIASQVMILCGPTLNPLSLSLYRFVMDGTVWHSIQICGRPSACERQSSPHRSHHIHHVTAGPTPLLSLTGSHLPRQMVQKYSQHLSPWSAISYCSTTQCSAIGLMPEMAGPDEELHTYIARQRYNRLLYSSCIVYPFCSEGVWNMDWPNCYRLPLN